MQDVKIILSEIVLVVVAALILANLSGMATTLTSITNETVTVTAPSNGTTVTLAHTPLDGTALVLRNHTGTPTLSTPQNYTVNTNSGVITFNTTAWGNVSTTSLDWHATYQYRGTGYDPNGVNQMLYPYLATFVLLAGLGIIAYANMM